MVYVKKPASEIKALDLVVYKDYRSETRVKVIAVPGESGARFGADRSHGGRMDTHFLLLNGDVYFEHEWQADDLVEVLDPHAKETPAPTPRRIPRPGNNPFTSDRGW